MILLSPEADTSDFQMGDLGLENHTTRYAGGHMTIVDAQVHIWGADTPEHPWPEYGKGYAHRPEPFGKDEL
jgi:hypothetical protein